MKYAESPAKIHANWINQSGGGVDRKPDFYNGFQNWRLAFLTPGSSPAFSIKPQVEYYIKKGPGVSKIM